MNFFVYRRKGSNTGPFMLVAQTREESDALVIFERSQLDGYVVNSEGRILKGKGMGAISYE